MKKYLLPNVGAFYKANLHVHTTVSDGVCTPEEVKKAYKEKGYSVVAFTDHELLVPHNDLTDDSFLALTAVECSVNDLEAGQYNHCYHFNLYSKEKDKNVYTLFNFECADYFVQRFPKVKEYLSSEQLQYNYERIHTMDGINAFIAKANAEGFLVSFNHPVWSLLDYEDYAKMQGAWGVEICNYGCMKEGDIDSTQPFVDLVRRRQNVFPLATDDAHRPIHFGGGWTMIKAEKLEYGAVMQALEKGDFYASTGPQIKELYLENGILHVTTSPVCDIYFCTERRVKYHVHAQDGELLTQMQANLANYFNGYKDFPEEAARWQSFIRVEIVDGKGRRAWSRAYRIEELL